MYQVRFEEVAKDRNFDHNATLLQGIACSDLERALALASLLQKISTEFVRYENIIVEPINTIDHETQN